MNAYDERKLREKAEEDARSGATFQRPTRGYKAQEIYDDEYEESQRRMRYIKDDPFYNAEDGDRNIKTVLIGVGILAAILIPILVAIIIVTVQESLVLYAVKYQVFVYIIAPLTALPMYFVGKGANKTLNILFYIGISVLATRFFAVIVELREGVSYINYIQAYPGGFWYLAKYTLLYIGYIAVIVGIMMLITLLIRKKKSS
ncbi:hypothetical protein P4679_25235 [Priestia megaterium]|uniref:hypothetical protein n=1 Tax=Priestia megaterium TaxID=1404 RepID=UPI002E20921F|nr:hypothetical protein [Priestia megaterium]